MGCGLPLNGTWKEAWRSNCASICKVFSCEMIFKSTVTHGHDKLYVFKVVVCV